MQEDNIAVKMVRPDLDDLPSYETPSPFSIRRYVPGDEQAWRQLALFADQVVDLKNQAVR